jgi:voltage-gated potassium channel
MGLRLKTWERLTQAVESGRIIPFIAGIVACAAVGMAVVMRVVDPDNFPSLGIAIWFSVVTLLTVGYGDVVPTDALGRVAAGVLMIVGITFIAFITAVVTSSLVSAEQRRLRRKELEGAQHDDDATLQALERVERRLEAIERKLEH